MKICPFCSNRIEDSASVCPKCQATIVAAEPAPELAAVAPPPPTGPSAVAPAPATWPRAVAFQLLAGAALTFVLTVTVIWGMTWNKHGDDAGMLGIVLLQFAPPVLFPLAEILSCAAGLLVIRLTGRCAAYSRMLRSSLIFWAVFSGLTTVIGVAALIRAL